MKKRRGASLATTLLLISVVLLAGMTLAGVSVMHMSVSSRVSNARQAVNLAESVIAQSMEKIVQANGGFAIDGTPSAQEIFELELPGLPPDARGRLTFDRDNALGLPHSTQTFQYPEGTSRVGYHGRAVPWSCFHLVGTGECNGVVRSVEVLLHVPPYPYALACSGPIHSTGPIVVGTLKPGQGGIAGADRDKLLPGHLASNSSNSDGIMLDRNSLVTGNLLSAGGVVLNPPVEVRGEVRTETDHTALPELDVDSLRLQPGGGNRELPPLLPANSPPEGTEPNEIKGFARTGGNLRVDGDLQLSNAVVWVEGDLHVDGGILGNGLLAVKGSINVTGGAALEELGQAALVAGGNVTLRGTGVSGSAFQGLVYSQGKFSAKDISVIGALVVKSDDPADGVELEGAAVGGVPEYTKLRMRVMNAAGKAWPDVISEEATAKVGTRQLDGTFDVNVVHLFPSVVPRTRLGIPSTAEFQFALPGQEAQARATLVSWLEAARDYYALSTVTQGRANRLQAVIDDINLNPAGLFDPTATGATGWGTANISSLPDSEYQLDLNQFLSFGDRVRVRLWQEL